jgi:hypothetical protein
MNHSHSVERSNRVVANKDKLPGPARPSPFSKSIQHQNQYGCCVRVSTFRSAPVKQNEFHPVNPKNSSKKGLPRVFLSTRAGEFAPFSALFSVTS